MPVKVGVRQWRATGPEICDLQVVNDAALLTAMASADLIPAAPLTVVTVPVPVPVPVDHCIPVPVPLTVERIIEHPVERTVEKTVERMVEKTVEKTVQQLLTVAVPVERTVEIEVQVESVLCKDMPIWKRRMRHIDVGGEVPWLNIWSYHHRRHTRKLLRTVTARCSKAQATGNREGNWRVTRSLFEKWQQSRGAAIFPEEDLHAVLREFQRAHSHARGNWVHYDMRIREYIRQRVDASVREQWEGNIVEDNVENVQQDDSSNNPLNSVMEDDEEWALSLATQSGNYWASF